MLVDEKFLFISLPRCASTSFFISCLKNNLKVNHLNSKFDNQYEKIPNLSKISNEELADALAHPHEAIYNLKKKFKNKIPIIAIKRNPYDRFISTYKHIVDELYRINEIKTAKIFQYLNVDDIFFFDSNDIIGNNINNIILDFLKRNEIKEYPGYVFNMLNILYRQVSYWHNHDPDIIWFDIKELNKLEEWVSNQLNIDFKLEKINSSQHFEINLKLDNNFIKKYDKIYGVFDHIKKEKTLF
jgi:hypothetical protein